MIVGIEAFEQLRKRRPVDVALDVTFRPDGSVIPVAHVDTLTLIEGLVRAQPAPFKRGMTCTVLHIERDGLVWRIRLAPGDQRDQPLFLGRRGGYTRDVRQAMRDEPEAVDPHVVEQFTSRARVAEDVRRYQAAGTRELSKLHERLRVLETQRSRGVDVSGELRVIEHRIGQAERKRAA